MDNTTPLIAQVRADIGLDRIREKPLMTYYTCVRYPDGELKTVSYEGKPITYYAPRQWSCIKGWYEHYDQHLNHKYFDLEVISFSKNKNTIRALEEKLGSNFVIVNSS